MVYDIKATIERGVLAKDLVARKHVRLIRTLGPDGLEASVVSVCTHTLCRRARSYVETICAVFECRVKLS